MNLKLAIPLNGVSRHLLLGFVIAFLILILFGADVSAQAQESPARLDADGFGTYTEPSPATRRSSFRSPDLESGVQLTANVTGVSGNLDPFVAILGADADIDEIITAYRRQVAAAIAAGQDPLQVIPEVADSVFLAWDDDSGDGYGALLSYEVPAAGDYQVVVLSSPYGRTFGEFELLLSKAAITPTPLPEGTDDDEPVVYISKRELTPPISQVITGSLTVMEPSTFLELNDVNGGDTLYIYAEADESDLIPALRLEDYGGKSLALGNPLGTQPNATLTYTFPADGSNYRFFIQSAQTDPKTFGNYRVLLGINDPSVLTGTVASEAGPIAKQPIQVQIGVKIDQITGVDQKAENFGVVADVRMEWDDPRLAYSPDSCQCRLKTYTTSSFAQMVSSRGAEWPEYTIFNQQGRRDSQSPTVVVQPDGQVIYVERFSVTLQAPDFNFKKFPFDVQQFYIRFRSIFPEEFFSYVPLPGYTGFGEQLGEEEWVIRDSGQSIDSQDGSSRFNFGFSAYRHLSFYIFRILLPVLMIIFVSWFTFFLKDYNRRIEVTSGNLLVFIAFNFTVSNDLPRLGYLTFMDTILISTFVVSALVIVLNVYLKRMEVNGRQETARRIDRVVIWFYPLAYFIAGLIVTIIFFGDSFSTPPPQF